MGSWHAVYIVCTLESYQLMSEPYLTCGTFVKWATEPITQGLVRPCTRNVEIRTENYLYARLMKELFRRQIAPIIIMLKDQ